MAQAVGSTSMRGLNGLLQRTRVDRLLNQSRPPDERHTWRSGASSRLTPRTLALVPRPPPGATREIVETQVAFPHLGEDEDLPGVHREMLHASVDGINDDDIAPLNTATLHKRFLRNCRERSVRLLNC